MVHDHQLRYPFLDDHHEIQTEFVLLSGCTFEEFFPEIDKIEIYLIY